MSVFKEPLSATDQSLANRLLSSDEAALAAVIDSMRTKVSMYAIVSLQHGEWVTDEVINAYMALIQAEFKHVFIFNTFFWRTLNSGRNSFNFEGVRSWTRRRSINIFADYSVILYPVNINEVHWVVAAVDLRDFTVSVFDSCFREFRDFHPHVASILNRYLVREYSEVYSNRNASQFPSLRWVPCSPALPQQLNNNDCGVFACLFSVFLAAGQIPDFAQPHEVRDMRQRIAVAFCRGQIFS